MAVSIMDLRMAKFSAAPNILNCPDIFCLTLTFRMAISEPLLSGGTSWMIEKGKDMITIFCNPLLKSNHLFVLRLQRFGQQIIQLFFQMRAKLIWIIVIDRSKLFFKFLCLPEHDSESYRPGYV